MTETRRSFLPHILTVGVGLIIATVLFGPRLVWWWLRPTVVVLEPESAFDAGSLGAYREPGVYTRFKKQYGVWIVHQSDGKLVALRTICTHLGCTPDWRADLNKFKCPCHGSEYNARGVNIKGPTKRPLERYWIGLERGRVVVDTATVFRSELGQWNHPHASVLIGRS